MPADGMTVRATIDPEMKRALVDPEHHFVQFYDDDSELIEALATYFAIGLARGEAIVCLAGLHHIDALERYLAIKGINVAEARRRDAFVTLDAAAALEQVVTRDEVMGTALPKRELFERLVGELYARAAGPRQRPVRAFGELVALLCREGNAAAAICLEDLWNDALEKHNISLFCGYPKDLFATSGWAELGQICQRHGYVLEAG